MPKRGIDFDFVRKVALELPGVEESTSYGAPSLKIRGKLLTCPAINKSAEPGSIVVCIDFDRRAELIATDPNVYYLTEHYLNYPSVLVRLSRIHPDALRDLIGMAWRYVAASARRGRRVVRGQSGASPAF